MAYATLQELMEQVGTDRQADQTALTVALSTAERVVDRITRRRFTADTVATARVYRPDHGLMAWVDDFHTTTDLVVKTDTSDNATWTTTWASTDYELGPLNGISGGLTGFPYQWLRAVGSYWFPKGNRRAASLQVTAKWGWAAVPDPVRSATLIAAEELWRMKDAPFGVAGISGLDGALMRVRQNPYVASLLDPYRTVPVLA